MNEAVPQPESSRTAILQLLCASGHTAGELASELRISASAVRKTLGRLQAEGLVRYNRLARGVGKPAHQYELTAEGELRLSRAYLRLLQALLEEIEGSLPPSGVEKLMRAVGERLAPPVIERSLHDRVAAAVVTLNDLGASASKIDSPAGLRIECTCCAIGAVVIEHPLACKGMEALLATHIGAPVREQCDRGDRPRCRFMVD